MSDYTHKITIVGEEFDVKISQYRTISRSFGSLEMGVDFEFKTEDQMRLAEAMSRWQNAPKSDREITIQGAE